MRSSGLEHWEALEKCRAAWACRAAWVAKPSKSSDGQEKGSVVSELHPCAPGPTELVCLYGGWCLHVLRMWDRLGSFAGAKRL